MLHEFAHKLQSPAPIWRRNGHISRHLHVYIYAMNLICTSISANGGAI